MGSDPLAHNLPAHSHTPPQLLQAGPVASCSTPKESQFPQSGSPTMGTAIVPLIYTALLLGRCRSTPRLPRSCWSSHVQSEALLGTARPGLDESHLPNAAWGLQIPAGFPTGLPGRPTSDCITAPCSDHFHQFGREQS